MRRKPETEKEGRGAGNSQGKEARKEKGHEKSFKAEETGNGDG